MIRKNTLYMALMIVMMGSWSNVHALTLVEKIKSWFGYGPQSSTYKQEGQPILTQRIMPNGTYEQKPLTSEERKALEQNNKINSLASLGNDSLWTFYYPTVRGDDYVEGLKISQKNLNDTYQRKQEDLLNKLAIKEIDKDMFEKASQRLDSNYRQVRNKLNEGMQSSTYVEQGRQDFDPKKADERIKGFQYIKGHKDRMFATNFVHSAYEYEIRNKKRATPLIDKELLKKDLQRVKEEYEKIKQQFPNLPEALAIAEKEYNYKVKILHQNYRDRAKYYPEYKRNQFRHHMYQQEAFNPRKRQERARMQSPRMYQYSQEFRAKQLKPREYTGIKPGSTQEQIVSPW